MFPEEDDANMVFDDLCGLRRTPDIQKNTEHRKAIEWYEESNAIPADGG